MKFNDSKKSLYNNTNLPQIRKKSLEKVSSRLKELKENLYLYYNDEDIRIDESFYSMDKPFIEKVPVIIDMNYESFNKLVDDRRICYIESVDYFVQTQFGLYHRKNNKWNKNDKTI